jgi:uncharacterized protein
MAGPMPVRQSLIDGAAGKIEVAESVPDTQSFLARSAIAIVAHPHPLFGGTMDNKVVTTLARAFYDLNAAVVRFNFRGIGQTEGAHDEGRGETDDLVTIVDYARKQYGADLPLWLAGFSFGGAVALKATERITCDQMVLVAPAFKRLASWATQMPGKDSGCHPPERTVLIHGETDETVPLADSFVWARDHDLAVYVVPGADHFFHRKLHHIKDAVTRLVRPL